jgi:large subunit ribosomal protein L15
MQIHDIKISKPKTKKRIGRGGKRGSYSGRGQKGQKSRAGRKIKPAIMETILRLPKLRGATNKIKNQKPYIVKINDLISKVEMFGFKDNINLISLKQMNLIPSNYKGEVKLIGSSEKILPLTIEKILISQKLKEKIIKAGGKVL